MHVSLDSFFLPNRKSRQVVRRSRVYRASQAIAHSEIYRRDFSLTSPRTRDVVPLRGPKNTHVMLAARDEPCARKAIRIEGDSDERDTGI